MTSESAYTKLHKSITSPPTPQKSLANSLQLDNVDWRKIYLLPRQTTIESSLRSFQYKILTNTFYLNERLCEFGIAESPLCSQCAQENESIIYLFGTCRLSHNLWEQPCAWLSDLDVKLMSPLTGASVSYTGHMERKIEMPLQKMEKAYTSLIPSCTKVFGTHTFYEGGGGRGLSRPPL